MKLIVLLGLVISCSSFADFVYMKESPEGKSIQLQSSDHSTSTTLNKFSDLVAIYPDISPDGKQFVFSEGPTVEDLHLTYVNHQTQAYKRFHLQDKGMLIHPKFSKNVKYVFYSAPGPKTKNTIFFFDLASEIKKQGQTLSDYNLKDATALVPDEEAYFPRPSSDANFVVYQRNTAAKKEIVLFDRLENTKKVLAEGMSPALSFDETLIAFTSKKDGNWNVYTVDRVTSKINQITFDAKDEMAPTFMPDNTLAFASNKSGNFRLFKLVSGKWISLAAEPGKETNFYSPHFSGEKSIVQNEKAPFIGNPRSSFGTVSHQGKLYMAGGHQGAEHTYPPESFTDTFIVYDPSSNQWTELAPRPFKAHGYQLAASGNYIYAFGGFAYSAAHKPRWKSLDSIDRYDIKANKWETIGKLINPRSSNVAVAVDDKVYLAGGWNATPKFENDADGIFHEQVEVFDFKTEKTEPASFKLPLPLRRALTGVNHEGKILLVGGLGVGASHFELLNQVTSIDPKDGTVTELAPLPFATFAPAAEILGDQLFVFGGMFKMGPMSYEYVSHIYAMRLKEDKWRHTGRVLKETKGFSQVFSLNEEVLGILGGHHYMNGEDRPVTTFETLEVKE